MKRPKTLTDQQAAAPGIRQAGIDAAALVVERQRFELRACARLYGDTRDGTPDEKEIGYGLEQAAIRFTEALAELRRREAP